MRRLGKLAVGAGIGFVAGRLLAFPAAAVGSHLAGVAGHGRSNGYAAEVREALEGLIHSGEEEGGKIVHTEIR